MIIDDEFLDKVKKVAEDYTHNLGQIAMQGVEFGKLVGSYSSYDGEGEGVVFEITKDGCGFIEYLGILKHPNGNFYAERMYPKKEIVYKTECDIALERLEHIHRL